MIKLGALKLRKVTRPVKVNFLTKEERKDLFIKRIKIKKPTKVEFYKKPT